MPDYNHKDYNYKWDPGFWVTLITLIAVLVAIVGGIILGIAQGR